MAELPTKTVSGVIRTRLAVYEARLYGGENVDTFVSELCAEGYTLKKGSFYVLFHRAKKSRLYRMP